MYDVLCTGLISCDLLFTRLEKFPELGKEVACEDFFIKPGGASNTPVALAKLGIDTLFVTTIGKDVLGRIIYDYLLKTGVNMSAVIHDESFRTSVSAVLSAGSERGFATYFARSDEEATVRQINRFLPEGRHVHTYIHDCLNTSIIDIARKHKKTISIDTAWDETIKLKDIKYFLENCDVFFTNEIEACSITGKNTAGKAMDEIAKYAKLVALKMGSKGSLVRQGNKEIRIPAANVAEVKDTTGAGDLYSAGFLYGYLKGWNLEESTRFASASGSVAVTFYGGMDDSYTLARVSELAASIGE